VDFSDQKSCVAAGLKNLSTGQVELPENGTAEKPFFTDYATA